MPISLIICALFDYVIILHITLDTNLFNTNVTSSSKSKLITITLTAITMRGSRRSVYIVYIYTVCISHWYKYSLEKLWTTTNQRSIAPLFTSFLYNQSLIQIIEIFNYFSSVNIQADVFSIDLIDNKKCQWHNDHVNCFLVQ